MGARPRERRARLLFAVPLGLALVLLSGAASSAEGPTIEAAGGGPYYWSPASAQTTPGGTVNFKNPSASVLHGVTWSGGPATPACSGVPIDDFKTSWSGSCTFPQAGSYSFYCSVHPTEMKGTITASSTGGPPDPGTPPPPPPTDSDGSPLQGTVSQAVRLAASQQGTTVRGSVNLSSAADGGKLDVELLMPRTLLPDAGRVGQVRVGRLVRGGLKEGRLPFAVSLRRVARRALQDRGRLALKVRMTITTAGGKTLTLKRSVGVHD
jgi:plastocyanin